MPARTRTSPLALATFRAAGRLRPAGAANWGCSNRSSRCRKVVGVDRLQRYNQRLVRSALRETRLLTALDVTAGRRIRVTSVTWDEYWGQCSPLAREIAQLKAAWTALIARNFASSLRPEFVRTYFLLLRTCLDRHADGQNMLSVLRKIVGFETIRVSGDCGGSAAAIASARHPVYLLSKLANPHAPENPKYLPLICPCGTSPEANSLYWHYRRIPLMRTDGIQLFVYPPAEVCNRPLSHAPHRPAIRVPHAKKRSVDSGAEPIAL